LEFATLFGGQGQNRTVDTRIFSSIGKRPFASIV
jgi:hypothetical protein